MSTPSDKDQFKMFTDRSFGYQVLDFLEEAIEKEDQTPHEPTMRCYNRDGTYTENKSSMFGWQTDDFIIDEGVPDFAARNKHMRFSSKFGTPRTKINQGSASISSSVESLDSWINEPPVIPPLINLIQPNIEEAKVYSTQETIEGPYGPDGKLLKNKLGIDLEDPPSRQKLASMINPCSVESRALLSILDYEKYRKLAEAMNQKGDIMDYIDLKNKLKFILNREESIEDCLAKEIRSYHANKEESMLSLMMELVLADTKCSIDDIMIRNKSLVIKDSRDNRDCDTVLSDNECKLPYQETSDKSISTRSSGFDEQMCSVLKSIGLSEKIGENLLSCNLEFEQMKSQVEELKDSFMKEENRVSGLVNEARKFLKEIRELRYLNDILHLMTGNLCKVKTVIHGFKIFLPKSKVNYDPEVHNLII